MGGLVAALVLGAAFLVGRWLLGHVGLWRLLRGAGPAPERVVRLFGEMTAADRRPPRLLVSRRRAMVEIFVEFLRLESVSQEPEKVRATGEWLASAMRARRHFRCSTATSSRSRSRESACCETLSSLSLVATRGR